MKDLVYQYGSYTENYYGHGYRLHTISVYRPVPNYAFKDKKYTTGLGTPLFEIKFQSNLNGEDKKMYAFKLQNFEIGDFRFKEDVKIVAKVSKAFYTIGGYSKSIRDLALILKSLKMKRAKYGKKNESFFIR